MNSSEETKEELSHINFDGENSTQILNSTSDSVQSLQEAVSAYLLYKVS